MGQHFGQPKQLYFKALPTFFFNFKYKEHDQRLFLCDYISHKGSRAGRPPCLHIIPVIALYLDAADVSSRHHAPDKARWRSRPSSSMAAKQRASPPPRTASTLHHRGTAVKRKSEKKTPKKHPTPLRLVLCCEMQGVRRRIDDLLSLLSSNEKIE